MIKILIVEDQTMLLDAMKQMINDESDMEVVGITGDASETLKLCRELTPDLVLMDVVTKNEANSLNANGIQYAAKIRKEFPVIKTVIMTAMQEITFVDEARKADIHSYIYKNTGKKHLLYVIRSTIDGIGIYPSPADSPTASYKFTENEISIIRQVCAGKTREEIVQELGISNFFLRNAITSILDKTGFDNITKFVLYALRRNLIVPLSE